MSAPPHIAVILNAAAGSGNTQAFASSLADKFRVHGLEAHITLARNGEEILAAARQATGDGVPVVVAGGGDGTINAVASVVAGSRSVMGVLPLGTLNHFARDLKIPLDLDEAVRVIAEGHTGKVDTGEVNGKLFLNNSSLGLYPDTVRHREQQQRRLGRGKWLAFFWAALTVLKRYPFLNATITLDGQAYHRRTPFIFIGNNPYQMEGFNIGVRDRLDT
ncbi:MAG: diacylglycerol kinase family protein, partial [Polaromonas sp.]